VFIPFLMFFFVRGNDFFLHLNSMTVHKDRKKFDFVEKKNFSKEKNKKEKTL